MLVLFILLFYVMLTYGTLKYHDIKILTKHSGWVARSIRALSQYTKIEGLIPPLGHIQESTSECINMWNNKLIHLSLSLSPTPAVPVKSIDKN